MITRIALPNNGVKLVNLSQGLLPWLSVLHNAPQTRRQASEALDLGTATSVTTRQSQTVSDNLTIESGQRNNFTPAERAVADRRQSLTLAGNRRVRIMWTTEMNKSVIQLYFKTTKMETDFTNYRTEMLQLFNERYPRFIDRITGAKLAERKRYLLTSNKISVVEINEIKASVERDLGINNSNIHISEDQASIGRESILNVSVIEIVQEQTGSFTSTQEEELCNNIANNFNFALTSFLDTSPSTRKMIPKLRYSAKLVQIIKLFNERILPNMLTECNDLEHLQTVVYCVAYATCISLGLRMTTNTEQRVASNRKPPWMRRLEARMEKTRVKLGRLTQYNNGIRSIKLINRINREIYPLVIQEMETHQVTEMVHSTTQRLRILANRLRRYTERVQRQSENKMFNNNQRRFYQQLKSKDLSNNNSEQLSMHEITEFWSNIWGTPKTYNKSASWLKEEIIRSNSIEEMPNVVVTVADINVATRKTINWKSPGKDGIHNYWYKKLTSIHPKMASLFNEVLLDPSRMPAFMTEGMTYLIPKDTSVSCVSNFRPITCLPTIYKILTSVIVGKTYQHCDNNSILTVEQKGCGIGSKGCKDQIIIDSVVVGQATHKCRNLSMAYIDYQKAYDSMPHAYLLDILKLYKFSKNIITFFEYASKHWNTTLCVSHGSNSQRSGKINIVRGIFQGDAFSPQWFCLGMNPLSRTFKDTKYGFELKSNEDSIKINHLFFMDDLKLFANSQVQLHSMLSIAEKFSSDINMVFNIDKTKTVHLCKGKLTTMAGYITQDENIISDITQDQAYKYLGFVQLRGLLHTTIKERMKKLFKKRVNDISKTLLNAKNKVTAINQYAIPYLTYSFGIVKWSPTDIDEIERNLRKCLRYNRMHDPKSAVERICLPRNLGGRGIMDIKTLYNKQIESLRLYFMNNEEFKVVCGADDNCTALHLKTTNYIQNVVPKTIEQNIDTWKQKTLHGVFPNQMSESYIDSQASNLWLTNGDLFAETEGFMLSIQDRVVPTKNYRKYILHQDIENDDCRLCKQSVENIDHILNSCVILAPTDYLERHNHVAKIIHQNLAIKCNFIEEKVPYYKYKPVNIFENNNYLLCWDKAIETDKEVIANRPDILYWDKRSQKLYIIDIAVPLNKTIQKTFGEKVRKYSELQVELKALWKIRESKIIPIIISSTGLVPNSLIEGLKSLDMQLDISSIQKAVILSTCHIVRKFLNLSN